MSDAVIEILPPAHAQPAPCLKGDAPWRGADAFFREAGNLPPILEQARQQALSERLPYAGSVAPHDAWRLFQAGEAQLVDIRTVEERKFVGHVPDTQHVVWQSGLSLARNPRFLKELENKVGKDEIILLLCRSGKRSAAAAEAATAAGFRHVFNVLQGFEGDLDEQQRRGAFNGWRWAGLPWVQD